MKKDLNGKAETIGYAADVRLEYHNDATFISKTSIQYIGKGKRCPRQVIPNCNLDDDSEPKKLN